MCLPLITISDARVLTLFLGTVQQYLAGKLRRDLDVVKGDICQQFTREMFNMYQGFAAYKNWDFEVLNYTNAEYGESCICLNVCYLFDSGDVKICFLHVYGILVHFWFNKNPKKH